MSPLAGIALLSVLTQGPVETSPIDRLVEARAATEEAATRGDLDALLAARESFEALTPQQDLAAAAHYFVGYVDSILGSRHQQSGDDEAHEACVDHGIEHLRAAVELDPSFADAHSMLGMLYLQKARTAGLGGPSLARRARLAMKRARALAPDNPRVVMLEGVRLWNIPGWLGGDRERAGQLFERALELHAAGEEDDPRTPSWGHADAHAWNGTALMERGELARAKRSYERALELRPGYVWIEGELLPELRARLAAESDE